VLGRGAVLGLTAALGLAAVLGRGAVLGLTAALGLAAGLTVVVLGPAAPAAAAGTSSDPYERGSLLCSVGDERLAESSGLVVLPDGRLVTVNDGRSGDLFYLDRACRVTDVVPTRVSGARDVEDLARGPDGSLWLADVGDNAGERETVALFRVPPSRQQIQRYELRYPDGPQDAEALIVDGAGRPFVVTKNALGTSSVLAPADPLSATGVTALREVATVSFTPPRSGTSLTALGRQVAVTGAALAPDGRRLVLRTYTDAYEWTVPSGDVPAALRGEPVRIPLPEAPQGEAIAYSPRGALLTTSERVPALVHELRRSPAGSAAGAPGDPSAGPASSSAARSPSSSPSPAAGPASSSPLPGVLGVVATGVLALAALAVAAFAVRRELGRRRVRRR